MWKNKIYYKYLRLISIVAFIVITSCKVKTKIVSDVTNELKINSLINNIENNYLEFNTIYVRFSAKYKKENKRQVIQGVYRIKRDSIIWFSMGPSLGIEILRAELLKDSMKFINRYDKTYYSGDYSYIEHLTNMNFDYNKVERILLNKLIFNSLEFENWKDFIAKNFDYNITGGKYILANKIKNESRDYGNNTLFNSLDTIIVLPKIYKIEKLVWIDREKERKLILEFSNFKKLKTNIFPQTIILKFFEKEKSIEIDLKIKQINVDKKSKYPYKIPRKKYKKIQLNE